MSLDSLVHGRLMDRFRRIDGSGHTRAAESTVESAVELPDALGAGSIDAGSMRLLESLVALAAIITALLIGIR